MTPKQAIDTVQDLCLRGGGSANIAPHAATLRRAIGRLERQHKVAIRIGQDGVCTVEPLTTRKRGASKSPARLQIEALEPGQFVVLETAGQPLESINQIMATIQRNTGVTLTRRYDPQRKTVTVTRIDGTDLQRELGRPPRYDFASLQVGQVMFITDGSALSTVAEHAATFRRTSDRRLRVSESLYDNAIEVQRIPDNGRPSTEHDDMLAFARVSRVLQLEGYSSAHGSTTGSGGGSTYSLHGAELFAGQLEDVLRILPPGQTVKISGVPKAKILERTEFWRERRGLSKVVLDGISVRFE